MLVQEIRCRSILNRSGIPGVDYALNAYIGCAHGCRYCYADFMKRFTRHKEKWGCFVDVKVNAAEVLQKQLEFSRPGLVSLGTVTDSYQPLEAKYEVTRRCLKELTKASFPVSIITKSPLILRDLDLLKRLTEVDIGITITTLKERIKMVFEPHSPSSEERFWAISRLSKEGIRTWLFFGPVLPWFSDQEEEIEELFSKASQARVDHILVDTLQLYPKVWNKMRVLLSRFFPQSLSCYEDYRQHKELYRKKLKAKVIKIAETYGLACRFAF